MGIELIWKEDKINSFQVHYWRQKKEGPYSIYCYITFLHLLSKKYYFIWFLLSLLIAWEESLDIKFIIIKDVKRIIFGSVTDQ